MPEQIHAKRVMQLPKNYNNLDFRERREVRLEYVKRQENLCCHCGSALNEKPSSEVLSYQIKTSLFPKNFFTWPVHLHHCHKTGMTIGAVHNVCNAVLWQYFGE